MIVDYPVELLGKLADEGRILHPHHGAAEKGGLQSDLGRCPHHADRVDRI